MEIHDAIGDGMVIVLTPFAIAAALVAVFAVVVKVVSFIMYGSEGKDMDVIGSHLTTPDGKKWDFSKSHSAHARAQRTVSAYDDKSAKARINPGPDEEEELGPDDTGEVIEFDTPDYSEAAPVAKTLKPKKA